MHLRREFGRGLLQKNAGVYVFRPISRVKVTLHNVYYTWSRSEIFVYILYWTEYIFFTYIMSPCLSLCVCVWGGGRGRVVFEDYVWSLKKFFFVIRTEKCISDSNTECPNASSSSFIKQRFHLSSQYSLF
jgi:hypothetical protein